MLKVILISLLMVIGACGILGLSCHLLFPPGIRLIISAILGIPVGIIIAGVYTIPKAMETDWWMKGWDD